MKEIVLTRGFIALVDDEDYEAVRGHKWHAKIAAVGSRYVYAATRLKSTGRIAMLHRFLMQCPAGYVVDHINGNTLDNRRANLRVCTQSQNLINGKLAKNSGPVKCRQTGRWIASVSHNGERLFLGRFDTKSEAMAAIRDKRRDLKQFQFGAANVRRIRFIQNL